MRTAIAKLISLLMMSVFPTVIAASPDQSGSAFSFAFDSIDGKPLPLSSYQGKVLLVVNTASFCGFTQQYERLQALSQKYESQGLVVIGVPSNDFGQQEPNSEGEIAQFCKGAFGVTFPLTMKTVVTGEAAHPFYKWAKDALGGKATPGWNFHKYLVGRSGRLIAAFPSQVPPDHGDLVAAVERELAAAAP